jgi:acyl-CoA thioester hydrolase
VIVPAPIQIRFADLDVMGHVNNTVYFSYMEMARVHYFKEILGLDWDWQSFGILIVHNSIDYQKPLFLHDELQIEMSCATWGNKSFELTYSFKTKNAIHAAARSVQVCYDSKKNETIQVPALLIAGLKQIQQIND